MPRLFPEVPIRILIYVVRAKADGGDSAAVGNQRMVLRNSAFLLYVQYTTTFEHYLTKDVSARIPLQWKQVENGPRCEIV
jgi:hypothetical protein